MEELLEYVTSRNLQIALIGDVNIDVLGKDSIKIDFLEIVQLNGCENIINIPIRIAESTETLIDICITNCRSSDVFAGVLTVDLCDQLPLFGFLSRTIQITIPPPTILKYLLGI